MCNFCENVSNYDEFDWLERNTGADDNVCEFINENNCEICDGCESSFNLILMNFNNNASIGVSFNQKIKALNGDDVIINPYSEKIQINFCPFCGRKISEELIDFNDLKYIARARK